MKLFRSSKNQIVLLILPSATDDIAPRPAVNKHALLHPAIDAMLHVFHLVVVEGARYKIPVRNPKVSPLTVLASADTESNDFDLYMICFLKELGKIAVE
jgi:hypothetical protein